MEVKVTPALRTTAPRLISSNLGNLVNGRFTRINIEFRRLNGAWPALEYAWLHFVSWCPVESQFVPGVVAPAGSFMLHYTNGYRVMVCGRNLRLVHQKLLEHQVKYLAEADRAMDHVSDDSASVVTRIYVVEPINRGGEAE